MEREIIMENFLNGIEEEIDKVAWETGLCSNDMPSLCFKCRSNQTCQAYAIAAAEVSKRDNKMIFEKLLHEKTENRDLSPDIYNCFRIAMAELEYTDPELFKKYLEAPAAKGHHGAHRYGLVEHSINVALNLLDWRGQHPDCDLSAEDCVLLGLFHDLTKADTYFFKEDCSIDCDREKYKHHALRTIQLIKKFGWKFDTKYKVMILLHMSGWENEEDLKALTLRDRLWLMNPKHILLVQAINWADMKATKDEELDELKNKL